MTDISTKILRVVLVITAGGFICAYILTAVMRIDYPYELEWMEGSMVDHVARVLENKPIFVEPSVNFVPMIYTPLFYYVAAETAKITGIGFFPLRLVAFLSSLLCFLLIFMIVRRETGQFLWGLLSAGLFAATYQLSGFWFDIARVDCFFLLFILLATFLIRFYRFVATDILAGLCMGIAVLAKQSSVIFFAAMCIYIVWDRRWRTVAYIIPALLLISIPTWYWNQQSHGWYYFYVVELPGQHPWVWSQLIAFWLQDILKPLMLPLLISGYALLSFYQDKKNNLLLFYAPLLCAACGISWLTELKAGGYLNALIPCCAFIAIGFGLGISRLWKQIESLSVPPRFNLKTGGLLLCITSFSPLIYNPAQALPKPEFEVAGDTLVKLMSEEKGEIFLTHHGHLPRLAGKPVHAHAMAMDDLWRGKNEAIKMMLNESIKTAFSSQRFSMIIVDNDKFLQDRELNLEKYYILESRVFDSDVQFGLVTGTDTRPEWIYRPRQLSNE